MTEKICVEFEYNNMRFRATMRYINTGQFTFFDNDKNFYHKFLIVIKNLNTQAIAKYHFYAGLAHPNKPSLDMLMSAIGSAFDDAVEFDITTVDDLISAGIACCQYKAKIIIKKLESMKKKLLSLGFSEDDIRKLAEEYTEHGEFKSFKIFRRS